MNILVSSCLLGENCKYSGANNENEAVKELAASHNLIAVCPEVLGGLPTPRAPMEIVGGRVVDQQGNDYTAFMDRGNEAVRALAEKYECKCAVMKSRSPSCGCGKVYDGTFSSKLVCGDGTAVRMLKKMGIKVINEEDLALGVDVELLPYGIV